VLHVGHGKRACEFEPPRVPARHGRQHNVVIAGEWRGVSAERLRRDCLMLAGVARYLLQYAKLMGAPPRGCGTMPIGTP
jgi:hypothetical protein